MTFEFRRHQIEAVDAYEDAFRAGVNRPLGEICVGGGKSIIYGELSRREIERGGRALILSPSRELAVQNKAACETLGVRCGINAAALGERTWRAPAISAVINSVFRNARGLGPISLICADEAHLWPHSEAGMLRQLYRDLGQPRCAGGSGTPFRLQGGSLVEGEGAPFDRIVYRYSIVDGIRDGYLVPPFSVQVDDKIDVSKLRVSQGEYTGSSQDVQMMAMMDSHIAQMLHYGRDRQKWLIFEASAKAARAMAERLNQWGIPTGLVLGTTPSAQRTSTVAAYRQGRLRALVCVTALATGFDVQEVDMLVCRRRTKSLSLWIQIVGRLLRTIGGNIDESIRRGKPDGLLLDFSGCADEFGPLDFIRPKETTSELVSCESCRARVPAAAMKCWSCDEPMTKNCPACLEPIRKGLLDCPLCGHDMRVGGSEGDAPKPQRLLERPSGAALIASYKTGSAREGGWLPVRRVWEHEGVVTVATADSQHVITGALASYCDKARWIRVADGTVDAVLVPNGSSRNSVLQVTLGAAGVVQLPVPMPSQVQPVGQDAA